MHIVVIETKNQSESKAYRRFMTQVQEPLTASYLISNFKVLKREKVEPRIFKINAI